ncbi:hypothetical protein C8R45DRAFT_1138088 [Mycena sanguinolenta]|nr:hypothetical protein C8R45DRAFT_1138088 [Mycena sanguinolenta]
MPVTIRLTDHRTTSKDLNPVTPSQIFEIACPDQFREADKILQHSIGGGAAAARKRATQFKIIPHGCGFVNTVLSAYTGSHALVLRPDDIWLTIMSQFSLYANANPELLGDHTNFVSHEPGRSQPPLIVDPNSPPLSTQMVDLMQRNVLDPALREWMLPNFSTSTLHDIAVLSMLRMVPPVNKVLLPRTETRSRGIPRVILEGRRKDWEKLLHKLDKLKECGIPAIAWYHLLYPVVSQIAKSFYDQNNPDREFWKKVVHVEGFGGGSSNLSGWITAFSLFSCEGKWRIPQLRTVSLLRLERKIQLPYLPIVSGPSTLRHSKKQVFNMTIDGIKYPVLNIHDLPTGYAEVNVTVKHGGVAAPCVIVAGLTGAGFSSSHDHSFSSTGKNDTVRPVVAWWMFSKLDQAQPQTPDHEPIIPDSGDGLSPAVPVPPSFVLAGAA